MVEVVSVGRTQPGLSARGHDLQDRAGRLTVFSMLSEQPEWAAALPDVLGETVAVPGADTLVLADAILFEDGDEDWLRGIQNTVGPVIAVCDSPAQAKGVLERGAFGAIPASLLSASREVALPILVEFFEQHESAGANDDLLVPASAVKVSDRDVRMERYMRDALHEFRTPLTVIAEFTGLCEDGIGGPLTDRQRTYLGHIQSAVDRLSQEFDDYRDGIRMRIGTATFASDSFCAHAAAKRAVESMDLPLPIVITGTSPSSIAVNKVDEKQFEQAIKRVIASANKLSSSEDPIEVSCAAAKGDFVEVRVRYRGVELSADDVEVMATGITMREDGFYRSVARVFGLGVSMARLFLLKSGGSAAIEVEKGRGATLVLRAPRQSAATPAG